MGGSDPPPQTCKRIHLGGGGTEQCAAGLLQRIITLPAQHRRAVALANPYELIIFFFVMHIPPALKPRLNFRLL